MELSHAVASAVPSDVTEQLVQITTNFSLTRLFEMLILFLVGLIVVRILLRIADKLLSSSERLGPVRAYIHGALKIVLWILLLLVVISSIGIDVTSLIAVLSVAGLAVSLALQNTLSNLAGGIQILLSRPFVPGDYIETGEGSGTVKEVGLAYSRLTSPDNKEILIPNSKMATANVINYTVLGRRRMDIAIAVSYNTPPTVVRAAALEALSQYPQILQLPAPEVRLTAYKDSAVEYSIRCWVLTDDYWDIYFGMMESLYQVYASSGVEMTYPHLNVHISNDNGLNKKDS